MVTTPRHLILNYFREELARNMGPQAAVDRFDDFYERWAKQVFVNVSASGVCGGGGGPSLRLPRPAIMVGIGDYYSNVTSFMRPVIESRPESFFISGISTPCTS